MHSITAKRRLFMFLFFSLVFVINSFAGLEAGKEAPAFKLPSLTEDKEVALSDFLGKVVVLHLWKCK